MAIENIQKFYKDCRTSQRLIEDLKRAQTQKEAIQIANEAGYHFDESDLIAYTKLSLASLGCTDLFLNGKCNHMGSGF